METNLRSPSLTLPLMMFGKNDTQWHELGYPVRERYIKGYGVYKTGKRAGQPKPLYDWRIKTKKQKVVVGYDGVFTRGKNKGQPKPVYETKDAVIPSTGFFPSVNHIYINASFRGGGGRRLKPIAEDHLYKWRILMEEWKQKTKWVTQESPVKVLVELVFYLPDTKSDTHNAKKLLLDAMEGVIHQNDYYIIDRTLDFTIDSANPRIDITFSIPPNLLPFPT